MKPIQLGVSRDVTPVYTFGSSPNKNWRHTDSSGHEHYWDGGYPTLNDIQEEVYDEYEHEKYHIHIRWECKECGEEIHPATRMGETIYVEGSITYTLNGEPITEEEYLRLRSELIDYK